MANLHVIVGRPHLKVPTFLDKTGAVAWGKSS